jgi:hypothetical protein
MHAYMSSHALFLHTIQYTHIHTHIDAYSSIPACTMRAFLRYTHTFTHIQHIHMHTFMHTFMYTYIHICVHVSLHTSAQAYMHKYTQHIRINEYCSNVFFLYIMYEFYVLNMSMRTQVTRCVAFLKSVSMFERHFSSFLNWCLPAEDCGHGSIVQANKANASYLYTCMSMKRILHIYAVTPKCNGRIRLVPKCNGQKRTNTSRQLHRTSVTPKCNERIRLVQSVTNQYVSLTNEYVSSVTLNVRYTKV